MTAVPPESPITEGLRSLEVRWIFPGRLEAAAGWFGFGRFPAETETRLDTYLLHPPLRELSVKIRGSRALEVKVYGGSPGLPPGARAGPGPHGILAEAVVPLQPAQPRHPRLDGGPQETAHQLVLTGQRTDGGPRPRTWNQQPLCEVELTEVRTSSGHWWTLGLEATGPVGRLRGILEAAAALVFAHALPEGVEPGLDECRSYAQWLGQGPGPDNADADATL